MAALDSKYEQTRRSLTNKSAQAANALWMDRDLHDRYSFISPVMSLVDASSRAYVHLLQAYFNLKSTAAAGHTVDIRLTDKDYSANALRPSDPVFPSQAYGTFITKLEEGKTAEDANLIAAAYLRKSMKTNSQMVQVRAAEDWTAKAGKDIPIVGFRRVVVGETCDHCRLAAERLYFKGELAPIHHGCDCGVAPVFEGEDHGLFTTRDKLVPLKQDSVLGPTLDQSVDVHV